MYTTHTEIKVEIKIFYVFPSWLASGLLMERSRYVKLLGGACPYLPHFSVSLNSRLESNKDEESNQDCWGKGPLAEWPNLIRTSISDKYDFSTKITTHVQLPVTSQCKCVVIFLANRTGDPRNRISPKYWPRLNRTLASLCNFTLHNVFIN